MDTLLHRTPARSSSSLWMNVTKKPKQASWVISVWAFSLHSEQSVFRTAPALKCVLNNKVSTSLTLSRTEGIAVERIQHLNTEFRMEVKKERYRLNLSLSSRLRATNTNLYKLIGIVNLMLPINAVLHGFLNPFNCSLGVSVSDIGPGLIIASI